MSQIRKQQLPQGSKQPKAYQLYMTDHQFYIKTTDKQFKQFQSICINRLTSKLTRLSKQQFEHQVHNINTKYREYIDLVMGVVIVNCEAYLLVVTEIQCPAILQKDHIHQIKKSKFIPFKHKFLYNSIDQSQNQKILNFMRDQLINNNFYFCYHEDLTLTRTKYFDQKTTQKKFWWNQTMLAMFIKYQVSKCFTVRVIQGHVREIYCENDYFSFYYAIISRRSKEMSGTRFYHRGLNDNFQCSNFVQTQEVMICHNFMFSHVSLRGSVPLFWKQESIKSDIILKHKLEQQHENGIVVHYTMLENEYKGRICTINLLSKNKMPQKDLNKQRFEHYYFRALKQNDKNYMYLYFDLNEEMKDEDGQKSIDLFIKASKEMFSGEENFFALDRYTRKVLSVQKIYPRINCLDCLDRTNVIMARISQHYLNQVEKYVNSRVMVKEKQLRLPSVFKKNLIELWVELGNRISMIYCGTESVANHMTKKQNNSLISFLSGGIKSINRYYNANVNDNFKQECIDFLLGRKGGNSETFYFQDNITRKILDQSKYSAYQEIKMYIVTWNCRMVDPLGLSLKEKQKIFTFLDHDIDLVIFCLQQIVQLNSYNVLLGNNENILNDWSKAILDCLNNPQINQNLKQSNKTFQLCANHDLVGIATFLFCTKEVGQKVKSFQWHDIKTGFKGNSGHKGGSMMFMQVDSTWITIINCHLASGQGKKTERFQDIEFMHNEALKDRRLRRLFDLSEYKFLVGDMNFCLEMKNETIKNQLQKVLKSSNQKTFTQEQLVKIFSPLLQKDQKNLTSHGHLSSYDEHPIYFLPTYKYDVKTKSYDCKKTPAWYDRILYQAVDRKKIQVFRYNDIDVYLSDHKPLYAMMSFLVKKQDLMKKKILLESYLTS